MHLIRSDEESVRGAKRCGIQGCHCWTVSLAGPTGTRLLSVGRFGSGVGSAFRYPRFRWGAWEAEAAEPFNSFRRGVWWGVHKICVSVNSVSARYLFRFGRSYHEPYTKLALRNYLATTKLRSPQCSSKRPGPRSIYRSAWQLCRELIRFPATVWAYFAFSSE
jgi:hypothetical protein